MAINTASMQVILQSNRRTSAIGPPSGPVYMGNLYTDKHERDTHRLPYIRDSVHIYTCLASTSARDLRKHSREDGRRVKIYSPFVGSSIRGGSEMKRVKPRDRLFARRINICSSAVSLFAGTILLPGGPRNHRQVMFVHCRRARSFAGT